MEGFLVRISFKPNSMKIISSKIMAYANANRALLIAMEVAVKPYTQQPTTMPDTVSLVSSSNLSSIDEGALTRLLCEGGRFVCQRKSQGLKTIYQQHMRYIQLRGLTTDPTTLFDTDLAQQIKEWRGAGERIVLVIDVNSHLLYNNLYRQLKAKGTELEEFSHKCWGPTAPYTHHAGSSPIDGAYRSPEVEIVNLCMLNFAESPGDHRSLVFDISTRSLLGEFRFKVCRPISRRLVTSQEGLVRRYNQIVREQFEIHRILVRLDAVDKMTRYCGYPSPGWLRAMIIKLYKQMTEIRVHAEKNCRKILRP